MYVCVGENDVVSQGCRRDVEGCWFSGNVFFLPVVTFHTLTYWLLCGRYISMCTRHILVSSSRDVLNPQGES